MIAKIGFVLLLIVFGVLTFLMWVFMPGDARGRLPGIEEVLRSGAKPGTPAPTGKQGQAPTPPAPAATAGKAPPLESLLIPPGAPGKARYTLQLGIFPDQAEADVLTIQVDALHLPGLKTRILPVRDRAGQPWWIAAAGDQDAPKALESARVAIGERLALNAIHAIQLPAAPQ
jgi:hypothetical protein